MLSQEQNDIITQVGPGTPAGELLRRYWQPVAATVQLDAKPTHRVRLLGEDLVLFRDKSGRYGLIQESCPHRRVSLAYGICEPQGIRCQYHGWLFDSSGTCLEMPNEPPDSTFHQRVRAVTYPVRELGGLLFAYLGPAPVPELPRWDILVWGEGAVKQIGTAVLNCNWFQIMENSVDPVHGEWLHGALMKYALEERYGRPDLVSGRYYRHHVKIGFDTFEYGIIKRRVLEGATEEDDDWKVGHPLVFPNFLRVGGNDRYEHQYRVPVDDTHTLHIWYQVLKPADVEVPRQERVPHFDFPLRDADGEYLLDQVNPQDVMAWETQGLVTDRTQEHLGTTDRGVILLRQLMKEQIAQVQKGEDPLGVIRDPALNSVINLPMEKRKLQSTLRRETFVPLGMGPEVNAPEVQETIERMVARDEGA